MRQPGIAIIIPPALCEIRRQIRSVLLHAQNLREKRFYLDGGISAAARHSRILSSVAVAPPRTTMSGDFSASPRITPRLHSTVGTPPNRVSCADVANNR
jgi:hypothetical protein